MSAETVAHYRQLLYRYEILLDIGAAPSSPDFLQLEGELRCANRALSADEWHSLTHHERSIW